MQVQLAGNDLARAKTSKMWEEDRCHFIYVEIKLHIFSNIFLLLKGSSSSKGFYARFWIINEVMNCSCCLLFCQSAVWLESRLTLCASDPWKAAKRRQIEPGIEYVGEQGGWRWDGEGRRQGFSEVPLNGAGWAHADADVRVRCWPGFTLGTRGKDGHGGTTLLSGKRSSTADVNLHSVETLKKRRKTPQISPGHRRMMWLRGALP